jgi:hypothetical protein
MPTTNKLVGISSNIRSSTTATKMGVRWFRLAFVTAWISIVFYRARAGMERFDRVRLK